ncbi:MAG: hypothetical protein UHS50_08990 [Bacteroidaceae bacterium]|nr:hypothetical protein [Bacteroidaceae bacterium]
MAYTYETRMVSARIYTESFNQCARLGVSLNAAANYGLNVLIKAHQRNMLYTLGFSQGFFSWQDRASHENKKATTLRIRHDYLDYIEIQGLVRNKLLNYAIIHVCSMIKNGMMFASAVSEGPVGKGIARRNVYTTTGMTGEEGQEP